MHIVIINGPNLNMLGIREPELYGIQTMEEYMEQLSADFADVDFDYCQSNHEGDLIDWLQQEGFSADGIIINAGGYSHTSVAIRDAIAAVTTPVVEVHITDIYNREPFRRVSLLTDVCACSIVGKGMDGYRQAVEYLLKQ
ncbi:MAG: type II 3-dehydroquinate dehydratase [Paludibacteraceae bacterium]|nr:type II 3-dehydroquinate dehydratase [Paludibacteraceae bacterium]